MHRMIQSIEKLEAKVKENERRLLDKCEQKKCRKISKKIRKVDIKFQKKFENLSSRIGEYKVF